MASGTISGTTSTGYVESRIKWTSTIDIAANTSTVTAELSYKSNTMTFKGVFEGYLWINGVNVECQKSITLAPGNWVSVGSFSQTIAHAADGTAAIEIFATGGISGTQFKSTTCSATVTLDRIPRTTTPSISGTLNVGSSVTINLPRAADTFTHAVEFSLDVTNWTTIATGVATSTTWTLPTTLASAKPNAASGTVYIRAITYANGVNIGSETISATYYIPAASFSPSVSVSASQSNSASIAQYIRGKSTVTLTARATSLKYSATAVKYVFTYGGMSKTVTSSATSASVSFVLPSDASASYTYSVTLTDSRGYTASASGTIATVAYSAPAITSLTATRGNYDGTTFTANDTGNSLKIVASGTITSLSNANAKKYALDYRMQTATAYTSLVASTTANSYAFSLTYYTDAIFSEYSAYVVKLTLSDSFENTNVMVNVSSKRVMLNFNATGTAIGVGTIAGDDNTTKFGWPLNLDEPLGVPYGGTGATTAAEALVNLGAAAASHTHALEITTLWQGSTASGTITLNDSIWNYPFAFAMIHYSESALVGLIKGATSQRSFVATQNVDGGLRTLVANVKFDSADGTSATVDSCFYIQHLAGDAHTAAVDTTLKRIVGVKVI